MSKQIPQVPFISAFGGKRRQLIKAKELHSASFITRLRFAPYDIAQEHYFVSMMEFKRGTVPVGIVHADYLVDHDFKAALFANLTYNHLRGGFPNVCPASRHAPQLVSSFLNEQYLSVTDHCAAHIYLGSSVTVLHLEILQYCLFRKLRIALSNFSGDFHQTLIPLDVIIDLAICKPCLT